MCVTSLDYLTAIMALNINNPHLCIGLVCALTVWDMREYFLTDAPVWAANNLKKALRQCERNATAGFALNM